MERLKTNSSNLDLLRSFAVLLVVGFHLAKLFNWKLETLRVTDFGLLGVMFFFVHTTLVLMFSLERQSASLGKSLFLPFMIRRCFRVYPLAILVVALVFLFRIPSDLQFGKFNLLHQSAGNVVANLLLVQNVALQKANPGVLWSLPFEIQMYLALPALFLFVSRIKSSWAVVAFWWIAVGLWFAVGLASGMLPLSEGRIRSPAEALLKFTRFAPCFLPGLMAYKFWHRPRVLPWWLWPFFLVLCCGIFLWFSGSQPIETGWFICFALGICASLFQEIPRNAVARAAQQVARYSYGIYLIHYFALWLGFVVLRRLNVELQTAAFALALISLPVILYHTIEAPLIAVGVRISESFVKVKFVSQVMEGSAERAPQIASE
jgi:peptidoglycan/LPS O-acetylase OafA/YrhL